MHTAHTRHTKQTRLTTLAAIAASLISSWGSNGSGEFDADVTNDGVVNGLDLAVILDGWGACPN